MSEGISFVPAQTASQDDVDQDTAAMSDDMDVNEDMPEAVPLDQAANQTGSGRGDKNFGPNVDRQYPGSYRNTFDKIDHHRLSFGYGAMREAAHQFDYAREALQIGMKASTYVSTTDTTR